MSDALIQNQKVKKPPPMKKRHTKPCRYFQVSNCPKSAEQCDFAHILAPTPITPNPKACRYFLAGSCTNGMWCRFVHPANPSEELRLNAKMADVIEADVRYPYARGTTDATSPYNYSFHASSPMSPFQVVYPGQGIPPPMWSPPYQPPEAQLPPYHQPRYPSPASSTTDPADDDERRGRDYSNPIVISSSSAVISPALHRRTPPQTHSPTPRNIKYKTKMCKFVLAGRQCPSGDMCTFIHEQERTSTHKHVGTSHLPSKPLSVKEESMKRGYFPVSWRVIGGGVKIGADSTTNVSLAYEDDVDSDKTTDDEFNYLETLHPTPIPLPPKLGLALADTPKANDECDGYSADLKEKDPDDHTPPARITPRPRANSIPNTPTVAHLQTRFSAET